MAKPAILCNEMLFHRISRRCGTHTKVVVVCAILALTGCAAGPNYQRPTVPTPPAWSTEAPWRAAAPKDGVPKSAWWTLYQDPVLDQLEKQALDANQSIQLAVTRV